MARGDCIDPDRVPCDAARKYLAKKGLLCSKKAENKPEKRKRRQTRPKSLLEEWFG